MHATLDGRSLTHPTDWASLFGRTAPLIVEIGFGNAGHLLHLARTRPDANVVGVEISHPSVRKAARKIAHSGLTNVRAVFSGAKALLWLACAPQAISELHINFPDPWPKDGHHHRRLIDGDFLHLAATRIVPGGRLYIATDHADYQQVVTDALADCPYFTSRHAAPYLTADPDRYVTKYETKAAQEGRTSFYYHYRRNDVPAPDTFALPEEPPMPHAILDHPVALADIGRMFTRQQFNSADGALIVRFIEVYTSVNDPSLLLETYISQEPLDQRLGLRIQRRDKGDLIIKVHDIGFPRVTVGVQFAVACCARWLLALHPDAALLDHNLPDRLFEPSAAP